MDEILKNLQEKLQSDIQNINKELKNIPEMEDKCKDIKINQVKISENLEDVLKTQKIIGDQLLSLNNQNFNSSLN